MKTLFTRFGLFHLVILLLIAVRVPGQTVSMKVHKNDSITTQLPTTCLDSINFTTGISATMYIHQNGDTIKNILLSEIDSVTNAIAFVCGTTTISDNDGNIYNTVQIGNQCWTKENLKTAKFADCSIIPNTTENTTWINLSTPAWCNYENSAANDPIYGKLYNWFTVTDPRNVCPTGWHVPSDNEWKTLELYLGMNAAEVNEISWRGGEANVGGKLKTTTGWESPNTGATNESGFSGLPGGIRTYDGTFFGVGQFGIWWSSSEFSTTLAWDRGLIYDLTGSYIDRGGTPKFEGRSVRCVRD